MQRYDENGNLLLPRLPQNFHKVQKVYFWRYSDGDFPSNFFT